MIRARNGRLAEQVFMELETHAQLEENVFYPAVNEETEDGPALVKESLEEHETMKHLIQELRSHGATIPDAFDAKFQSVAPTTSNTMWQKKKPPCSPSLRRSLRKT